MHAKKTSSNSLIQIINSMPEEMLNASIAGANKKWVAQKVNAVNHYRKLNLINAKSKIWKKISVIELESPLMLPGIPEIANFKHESWLEEWAGYMEITEAKITTYLSEDLRSAGVIFQDVVSAFGSGQKLLETTLKNSMDKSVEKMDAIAYGTADHGFYLSVPDGLCVEKPFKVTVKLSGTTNLLALILVTELGNNSSVKIILELKSDQTNNDSCFIPMTHTGKIGNNSEFELVEIQELGHFFYFFPNESIEVCENGVLNRFILDKGSQVTRRGFSADLNQPGGSGTVTGVYIPKGLQTYLYDTRQNHTASNTNSNLLFKGVLDNDAYALWKGNILVAEGVNGADGYQLSNTLLLNPAAHAESIPGLEISTDDVKCSHGVTMSSVDKDQLFYLETRGIGETVGKKLIVDGFIRSAISRIKSGELQEYVKENLDEAEADF
jgi:Fe-S cluster assembly protein SufD